MHALSTLNREFVALGWNRKATGRILLELGFHVSMALGGTALVVLSESWLLKALGMLISTTGSLGVSTNTHTSSHYSTSDKRWVNRVLTYFGYPFFLGFSATYWWNKHVAVHHPTPNVIGFDDDADLLPFFALNEKELADSKGLRRWWFEVQWVFIPFAIAINGFNVQRTSWSYLLAALRDPSRRTVAHWADLGTLLLHHLAWVVVPGLVFGWGPALAFYLARIALMGYALFVAFAPAHFPAEARFLAPEIQNRAEYFRKSDFFLLQTATTINFRTGFFGRLLCSGVDYQIEHHLFPGYSHTYYPEMSRILRKFCEENGYPYRTLGWGEAVWKSLVPFKRHKPVEPRMATLREKPGVPGAASAEQPAGLELPAQELVA